MCGKALQVRFDGGLAPLVSSGRIGTCAPVLSWYSFRLQPDRFRDAHARPRFLPVLLGHRVARDWGKRVIGFARERNTLAGIESFAGPFDRAPLDRFCPPAAASNGIGTGRAVTVRELAEGLAAVVDWLRTARMEEGGP